MSSPEILAVDFPACLAREFPAEYPAAWRAAEAVLAASAGADLGPLARRSPALKGYDWRAYLLCSVARMVRALAALRARGLRSGRVLDYGAYFGNFALMAAESGYRVDAADSYAGYEPALDGPRRLLRESGVDVLDFEQAGYDLPAFSERYDAAFCMGVIEHVPHSPKPVLETLDRVLKPGGVLVLDTPNLAYLYTRERLSRGESIFAPIAGQFHTERPFEGHHREYVPDEVAWMLREIGHVEIELTLFNYSYYGLATLAGDDLRKFRRMQADPSLREVILAVSRKPWR